EEVDGPWHPGPRQLLGERRRCRNPNGWQFDDTLLPGWTVGALDEARAAENRQENESGAGESTRSPRGKGTRRLHHALDGPAPAAWGQARGAGGDRPGAAQRRPRPGNEPTLTPQPTQDAASLSSQLGQRLHRRGRLDHAAGQLRMPCSAQPLALELDGLDHEQIRHGLVVREVGPVGFLGSHRHQTKGTQAMGTPASDWRGFPVAVIQLSPSGRRAEAGRTRQRLASSTLAGTTPRSRSARAASMSRRLTKITMASLVPRCSWVRS